MVHRHFGQKLIDYLGLGTILYDLYLYLYIKKSTFVYATVKYNELLRRVT